MEAAASEPEKASQEPAQSFAGRIVDEAGMQLVSDVIGALVKGASEAAADCAGAIAGAAGTVAGAVVEGVSSL